MARRTLAVVKRCARTECTFAPMGSPHIDCDTWVVGAGPAGLAAACRAAEAGKRVTVVDDNPNAGGQIWRGEQRQTTTAEAASWFERIRGSNIQFLNGARVFHQPEPGKLLAEMSSDAWT